MKKLEDLQILDMSGFRACLALMPIGGGAPEKEKEKVVEEEVEEEAEEEVEEEEAEEDDKEEADDEETEEEEESEEEDAEDPDDDEEEDGKNRRDASFEGTLQELLQEVRGLKTAKATEENVEKEWTLADLASVEARIEKGELDPKYKVFVAEKRAEIISERTANKHLERMEFNGKWSASEAKAAKEFKDLANPKSELKKIAAKLVLEDANYQKYAAAARKNLNVNPAQFGLDPELQYKCAQRAFGMLKQKDSARPKSKTQAKDGLEGGGRSVTSTKVSGQKELDVLEAAAVKSGSQSDWKKYFTKREAHLRGSKK